MDASIIWLSIDHLMKKYKLVCVAYCGLMMAYGAKRLGQQWLREWLVASQHPESVLINHRWGNVVFAWENPHGIHLKDKFENCIFYLVSHILGANELILINL